jgi:serine/threonine-protein kinase
MDPLLEAIILKAIAKDAQQRQQSMRELRTELRELLDPIMVDASPPPPSLREVWTPGEFQPIGARQALPTLPEDAVELEAPPSKAAPPKPSPPQAPAWLERGPVYAGPPHAAHDPKSGLDEPPASSSVTSTMQLAQITDPKAFGSAARRIEPNLRGLAARGDMHALWTISEMLHNIVTEGSCAVGSRAWTAAQLLRVFDDPAILVQIGEQLLNGAAEMREEARRLLVRAGVAGAYGLYGARVKLARVPASRPVFISMLSDFGPKAWPVVRASLEKVATVPQPNTGTLELAEDLLLCVPAVGDESTGHLVVKFLRYTHVGVCRAATAATIKLWRDRAKPLLVAMVSSKEDVVRVAGLAGLRQLGAIDEHVVPRLHAILTQRVPAGEEVRAAAALALAHASQTARQPAVSLLAQLLTPGRALIPPATRASEPRPVELSKEDAVVLAIARSLLTVGGKPYRGLVAERAERSTEPLRAHLRGLLA